MKAEESLALISYRLERSRESLRAAEIMFENNMLTFSMNRVYYAMFYAVQALLVSREVSFSKHGQVKAYFNREMIKTGILPDGNGCGYTTKLLNIVRSSIMSIFLHLIVKWSRNTLKRREVSLAIFGNIFARTMRHSQNAEFYPQPPDLHTHSFSLDDSIHRKKR